MISVKPELGTNLTAAKVYKFKIGLNAASTSTILEGRGASTTRTAQGVYTVTLLDLPMGAEFKTAQLTLCKASGTLNGRVDDGGYASATGIYTFYFSLSSTGALADPPATAATNYVSVELTFGSPSE